ncbi:MAG: hypothetical protein JWP03_788, partial [Phycisphaerales bacterium]|nr:hypothetical protein [Phycisphaerales bacterium]
MGIISQLARSQSKTGRVRRQNRSALIAAVRCAMEPLESRIFLSVTNAWKSAVSGDFDNPTMWSLGHVPTSTEDAVINVAGSYSVTHNTSATDSINSLLSTQAFSLSAGSLSVSSTVEVDNTFTLSGGTLAGATVLPGTGGQGLTATSGTLNGVTLNGGLAVSGNVGVTVVGGLTLNGTATLGDSNNGTGGYLSFTGSQTLAGTGLVVFGSASSFNALVATATGTNPNPVLTIGSGITVSGQRGFLGYDTTSGIGATTSVINNGTIQWSGGTNISVPNTLTNNGTITVSSTAVFSIGGTLKGGTLTTQTGAQISGGTLDGVTISGDFFVAGNSGVTILDSLTLDGTATLGSPGTGGYLSFTGSQTLAGTGSVVFGSASTFNSLVASGTNAVLTIGSGITVSGQTGSLGYDTTTGIGPTTTVINDGTIQWSTGTNISVPNTLTNDGTITVSSTGNFSIGGTLIGGTLTTHTGAQISGGTLDGVIVSGDFFVAGNNGVTILHSLTLDGTATLGSSGTGGYLSFTGSQTLAGTGAVVFGSTSSFNALVASGTNAMLTIGSGITVSGQTGFLGYDTTTGIGPTTTVINDGIIQWSTGTNISVPNTLTNDGTITVSSTAVFSIGGTLKSGTLTTQTGAQISGGVLDGVTISGSFGLSGNNSITILDGLTLDGTATLGSSGNGGYLIFSGSQTLGGTGSVVFGTASSFNSLVATGTNPVLTIGSGITVSGQTGSIGYNPTLGLGTNASVINEGAIQASVTGGTITINSPNNTSNNLGSIVASSGTLALGAPTTLTNNGTITVGSTGVFSVGGTLKGGTLTTQAGAQVNGGTLDGVTVSGSFGLSGNNSITILDGLTLDGTATLGSSGNGGYLVFSGSQTLGGTGAVVFGTASSFNSLAASGTNAVLTIGSGITVSGQTGYLGYDPTIGIGSTASIINQGTIQANVSGGTITVNTPGNTFDNLGSVIASSGALALAAGGSGFVNDGSVTAGPTGAINVTGNFTQASTANFNIVLGGATSDLYGHMAVSGTAAINGGLNISEANGFSPGTGNLFKVLTFASESGQFANYNGLTLPAGAALQPGYDPTDVTLTTVTSTTIAPDLRVINLTTNPVSPQSGQNLMISWNDFNAGNGSTGTSWTDHVVVTDTTTNQVLASADVPYNAAVSGSLPSNGSSARSYTFRLPDGSAGVGNLHIVVSADYFNTIAEFYPGNVGESNNTSTIDVSASLASYPDLAPSSVTAPPSILPGKSMNVSWTLSNSGTTVASGPWTEQIFLTTDAAGDNPTLVGAVNYAGPLAAGASVGRSVTVNVPALSPGNYWVLIRENPFAEIFETNTANNGAVSASPSALATALTLTLASHSVAISAGANATTAIVSRNGSTASPLSVTITNPDSNDLTTPATVIIPAGQSSVSFNVGTIDTAVAQGSQNVTLTASANGTAPGSDTLTITDSRLPALTVSLSSHSISESSPNPAATGMVTRNTSTAGALVVKLVSNATNKLQVPATVTIPAGQSSATFDITVLNDQQIDGDAVATISASAADFASGSDAATVLDVNIPTMTLTLTDHTVSEDGGIMATTGTVTLGAPATTTVVIGLSSSDTSAATVVVPQVIINAGQTSAVFAISAVDDGLDLGDKTTTITAQFVTLQGKFVANTGVSDSLTVIEHDGAALSISLPVAAIGQGGTTLATVSRNTATAAPLTVMLASSDTTHATVPISVIIPAGQASANFVITGVDDNLPDGEQFASIVASATGFENAIARIGVTSVNLPDLVVTNVFAPASADAGSIAQISFTIVNNGLYRAGGPWNDQIYLDPTDGGTGGGLIDTISFNAELTAGGSYSQTQTITLPTAPGHYSVRIVADSGQDVQELSFNNNTLSSPQPLDVTAPYNATVFTTLTGPVANGTAIVLSGHASLRGSNLPAANVPVAAYVTSSGLVRTLTATTDGNGNYSTTFLPFPLETGTYSITAGYPGAPVGASQGQFTIVGIGANPSHDSLRVQVGTPLDGQITLTNLGTSDLSGITAVALGGPAALNAHLTVASTLAGSGQTTLSYTLSAAGGGGTTGTVLLHITSAEGAVLDIPINVTLVATTPQLVLNPTYLNAGMLVGQQTLVSFQVTNNGGAASGDVQILLPNASYLSLASAATIPSLAPGQSATVTLALSPAANLALGQYTGTLALNYDGTGLSIPYTFTAISSAVGDVQIIVDDIFTFNASGAPRVAGASVSLLDPYDNSHVIATGTSNADGLATITAVPAGQYVLQVSAPDHDTYRASLTVVPGITNVGEVFLLNQLVTYTWQVTPTTISDQYSVKLETTFKTEVPAPVVTLSGPDQIPTLAPGQSAQMDIVVTNHGLIAAQGVSITLPTDPEYTFTAPTTVLGTVPAMSSVTVPVMVSRLPSGAAQAAVRGAAPAASSGGATPATDNSSSPCTVYVPATYFVICGGIKHELTTSLTLEINGRVCNALGIVAGFLASLFGGGGFPYFPIILPPIYITPGPPGTVLPPGKLPPQFPIDDVPNPPAVENPSNCDPVAELAGALAAKALAGPVVGPINDLFGGLNLLNGLLNGHPSHNPLDYANALAAGVGGPAGDLFGNLSGMGKTLHESGYTVPGFGSPSEEGAAAPLAVNSSELHAALSDANASTLRIKDLLQP